MTQVEVLDGGVDIIQNAASGLDELKAGHRGLGSPGGALK